MADDQHGPRRTTDVYVHLSEAIAERDAARAERDEAKAQCRRLNRRHDDAGADLAALRQRIEALCDEAERYGWALDDGEGEKRGTMRVLLPIPKIRAALAGDP